MVKHSKKRLSLLRLIKDYDGEDPGCWVYFPGLTYTKLREYGLCANDTAIITFAEKVGLIKRKSGGTMGQLTKLGLAAIAAMAGQMNKQQCQTCGWIGSEFELEAPASGVPAGCPVCEGTEFLDMEGDDG